MVKFVKYIIDLLSSTKGRNDIAALNIDDTLVAAGDPASSFSSVVPDTTLPLDIQEKVRGLKRLKVRGSSMSPFGIAHGDIVYVGGLESGLNRDDIVVVKVDPAVYDRPIQFNHKMRRYLMDVPKDESLESVQDRLAEFHKDILVPEFQQRLKKKFDKTKGYYPDKDLCLSITFRNGDLRYSFHPRELVEYKVKFIVSMETNSLVDADTIPAY